MNRTNRTKLRRLPNRGSHELAAIYAILDSGFLAHVGFQVDNQPYVIPTLYGRDEDKLYLHGSAASHMLGELEKGVPACVTVTLVDGLVLARSAFHHSMNYRSVVAFGTACKIVDQAQKSSALRALAEHFDHQPLDIQRLVIGRHYHQAVPARRLIDQQRRCRRAGSKRAGIGWTVEMICALIEWCHCNTLLFSLACAHTAKLRPPRVSAGLPLSAAVRVMKPFLRDVRSEYSAAGAARLLQT